MTIQHTGPGRANLALAIELLVLLGVCFFLFFFGLGRFGLLGADEPRYAQIAREMLSRHDWITPVLNGSPWLEKPPFFYWSAMISYSIFGVSDWSARLPNAVFASMMVFGVFAFLRHFRRGIELDSALMLASSALIVGFARAASTDMPLTATLTIALLAWLTWDNTAQRSWLAVSYAFLALGMLAKGPVAPFLGLVFVVIYTAFRRNWKKLWNTLWWPGLLLFLVISLPWYVLVQLRNHEFFRIFILEHNLARYTSNEFRHPQPFWYFVPVAIVAVLPWSAIVLAGTVRAVRDAFTFGPKVSSGFELFLTIWALFPILFFSISQSKLPGYILPAIPPLVLLGGNYLWRKFDEQERVPAVFIVSQLGLSSALLGASLMANYFVLKSKPGQQAWITASVITVFVFAILLGFIATRGVRILRFLTLLPLVLALGFIVRYVAFSIDLKLSARPVAAALARFDRKSGGIAVFEASREMEYGLNFYRNQQIFRYERNEIPSKEHIVVARPDSLLRLRAQLGERGVVDLGSYPMQNLEFYFVESAH